MDTFLKLLKYLEWEIYSNTIFQGHHLCFVDKMTPEVIYLPKAFDPEWQILSKGLEEICGFPNCYLSVDGYLFESERRKVFFG